MRKTWILLALIVLALVFFGINRLLSDVHYILSGEPGDVLYVATFDDFNDDWQEYDDGSLSAAVGAESESTAIRLVGDQTTSIAFAYTSPYFADFDATVQATAVDGPWDNGFGLMFRLQNTENTSNTDDRFYVFFVSSDGYYQVRRVTEDGQTELSTWIPSPLVEQGFGVTNTLRVIAKGDEFQFFINGEPVEVCIPNSPDGVSTYVEERDECLDGTMQATLVDDTIPSGRMAAAIWMNVEPGVTVDFDNLVVLSPEE